MYQQGPFNIPPYGPNFKIPLQGPLPLGQAVKQLFKQYVRVFTSPSRATLAQELPKAAWNIVWVQLIAYAIFLMLPMSAFGIILVSGPALAGILSQNKDLAWIGGLLALFLIAVIISPLIFIPLSFFTRLGIQYLTAKMLGGNGRLVEHGYAFALIDMPTKLLNILSFIVPGLGLLALTVYEIILHILMVMTVHRISGVKATIVVFSPIILSILLVIVIAICAILFKLHG